MIFFQALLCCLNATRELNCRKSIYNKAKKAPVDFSTGAFLYRYTETN